MNTVNPKLIIRTNVTINSIKKTRDLSRASHLVTIHVNPTQIKHNQNHSYTSVTIVQQTINDD